MLKRTLLFSSPMNLSLKDSQLVLYLKEAPDEKRKIPIEDIGYVILEHPMISITLPLLNALSDNNVAVIICGSNHMPNAMLQNLDSNTTQGEVLRSQIAIKETLKKSLWKQTIETKIKNQSQLLNKLGKDGERLKPLYQNVKSGDTTNREAVAAKLYWSLLFEDDGFLRDKEGFSPNNLLNYGYTILRAAVARSLMGSGILPNIGLFHKNRYNAFPLADDIMEPFRPFVDETVFMLYANGERELTINVKSQLLKVLVCDTLFTNVTRPLDVGLSITTASLAKCFMGKQSKISYPLLT